MPEDYSCPECFECGDECSTVDGKLVCDECGKTYTQEQWDDENDKACADYVAYIEKLYALGREEYIGKDRTNETV